MTRIIIGFLLSLLAIAPAQAWEFYTAGRVEASNLIGLDHAPGQDLLHNSYGMVRDRHLALSDATLPHFGVRGITMGERSDYPCFLNIDFGLMTGGTAPDDHLMNRGRAFTRCGDRGPVQRSIEDVQSNGGLDLWPTGLAACSAESGRIEGIRMISSLFRLDNDTKQIEVGGTNTDSFARDDCDGNWSADVSCRANQIIVGLDVFYMYDRNGRREADSIIGFQLHCRALAVRP